MTVLRGAALLAPLCAAIQVAGAPLHADSYTLTGVWCLDGGPSSGTGARVCPHAIVDPDTVTFAAQPDVECFATPRESIAGTQAERLALSCIEHDGRDGINWYETWLILWIDAQRLAVIRGTQIEHWSRPRERP